ncbi:dopamine receptor 1-like [Macrobrachium rosenbergii]|uniref:dopamine receptor 1-like n=1 Tax=Macrobrachium rosenbergii TaxID=79674 RepID=UPI0034D6C6D0
MVHTDMDCKGTGCMETSVSPATSSFVDSTTGKVLIGILLSLVIFLSIFGNVLVCLAVYTDRNLRKIGNLFVVSLAIADLFVACVVMTFALVNDLLGYWPFGRHYCDTWIAFDVMCSTASIVNLCAISLDRYIHIKDPLRYGRWMTKRIVTLAIAGIWLLSALISFLPISLGLHLPDEKKPIQQPPSSDKHEQCALELSPTYAVVSSCISFFLPCCVMLGIYSRLYLYAKRHVESIKALVRPVTLGSLEGDTSRPKKVAAPCHVSESKAATTVGIIVGTFLTCWVPFFCVNIAVAFCDDCIPLKAFQGADLVRIHQLVLQPHHLQYLQPGVQRSLHSHPHLQMSAVPFALLLLLLLQGPLWVSHHPHYAVLLLPMLLRGEEARRRRQRGEWSGR